MIRRLFRLRAPPAGLVGHPACCVASAAPAGAAGFAAQLSGCAAGRAAIAASFAVPSASLLVARRAAATKAEESISWTTTPSGLQFCDELVGEGEMPVKGQTVHVHYTGRLENGQEFDSSIPRGQPLEFPVGSGKVIAGWDEGILTMRVGGKRKLKIPSELGYGRRGTPGGPIPPNATLHFDCELVALGSKSLFSRIFG